MMWTKNIEHQRDTPSTSRIVSFETPSMRDWSTLSILGVKINMRTYIRTNALDVRPSEFHAKALLNVNV